MLNWMTRGRIKEFSADVSDPPRDQNIFPDLEFWDMLVRKAECADLNTMWNACMDAALRATVLKRPLADMEIHFLA